MQASKRCKTYPKTIPQIFENGQKPFLFMTSLIVHYKGVRMRFMHVVHCRMVLKCNTICLYYLYSVLSVATTKSNRNI